MTPERHAPRVLFIDHSAEQGGGQLSAERLLPRLARMQATAVYFTDGPVAARLRRRGVDVRVLDSGVAPRRALADLLQETRPEIICCHSTASARTLSLVPRGREVRLLRLSEDMDRYKGRGLKSAVYFGWVFPRFDGFIANSAWTATTVPKSLRRKPIRVAYPISGVSPAKETSALLSEEIVRAVTLSRPEPWKGIDLAIEAVRASNESSATKIRLDVYGGGHNSNAEYVRELRSAADRTRGMVHIHGHISDVTAVLRDTDIVIVPSRLPEPFGQVTAQALAAGRVAVVSEAGGSLELVEDGVTGFTFRSDDSSHLAEKLRSIIGDRESARRTAARGHVTSSAFADDVTALTFEAAILDLHSTIRRVSVHGTA